MILPDTAKGLAYYDQPFFATYPAITRNAFGKGTLTYEGTALSDPLQDRVLLSVLELAGFWWVVPPPKSSCRSNLRWK
jgi:beta-galactosidase